MKKKMTGLLAMGAAASLMLAGCASETDNGGNGGATTDPAGPINVAYIAGWTDGQSMAYLLENQLTKLGYDVNVDDLVDNGPMYAGLSQGDVDVFASAWPEVTQAEYWEEYGDSIEDLATWYDGAVLTIAVPSYSQIESLDELADNADLFNGEIIGIEPGAGLTGVTENSMMPTYGLEDDYSLATSSTASMLTLLGQAIDNEEEIVVTLWRPFWAYGSYDIRDLADPEQAMGEPEGLHVLARDGFEADYADAVELIEAIKLDDDAYAALESLVTSEEYEDDTPAAVEAWIADHGDAFPTLIS